MKIERDWLEYKDEKVVFRFLLLKFKMLLIVCRDSLVKFGLIGLVCF